MYSIEMDNPDLPYESNPKVVFLFPSKFKTQSKKGFRALKRKSPC